MEETSTSLNPVVADDNRDSCGYVINQGALSRRDLRVRPRLLPPTLLGLQDGAPDSKDVDSIHATFKTLLGLWPTRPFFFLFFLMIPQFQPFHRRRHRNALIQCDLQVRSPALIHTRLPVVPRSVPVVLPLNINVALAGIKKKI